MNQAATLPVLEDPIGSLEPDLPEYVVISGKGGTGKTSLAASFAVLESNLVLADCDVDAANCHLVLEPSVSKINSFTAGSEAVLYDDECENCGLCADVCRFGAIRLEGVGFAIDPLACEGCSVCAHVCPNHAISMAPSRCGEWFISETRRGPMVHARLGIAAENSGKLVSAVRSAARDLAGRRGSNAVLIDGPPGLGCPVIAAITGATSVLVVTEPTVSGAHDLSRILELTRHFRIPAAVTVNRWDLYPDGAAAIEETARLAGARVLSRIRFDGAFTRAQIARSTVVELGGGAADDIRTVWREWMSTKNRHA